MRRWGFVLIVAFLVSAVLATPAEANFTVGCSYHHSLTDDPIVYPGMVGASHSHDFFGNKTTDANSTTDFLEAGPTTCGNAGDTAAYWAPSAYLNGVQVLPRSVTAYYYRRTSGTLTPFPKGFEMVAGNSHATSEQSTSVVYWGCGHGSGTSKVKAPPDCSGHGSLAVHILFPYCWTGDNPVGNSTSQVSYTCDSAHPVHFPQLVIRENFSLVDAHAITLASGSYVTEHADYFSTWQPGVLEGLVSKL